MSISSWVYICKLVGIDFNDRTGCKNDCRAVKIDAVESQLHESVCLLIYLMLTNMDYRLPTSFDATDNCKLHETVREYYIIIIIISSPSGLQDNYYCSFFAHVRS